MDGSLEERRPVRDRQRGGRAGDPSPRRRPGELVAHRRRRRAGDGRGTAERVCHRDPARAQPVVVPPGRVRPTRRPAGRCGHIRPPARRLGRGTPRRIIGVRSDDRVETSRPARRAGQRPDVCRSDHARHRTVTVDPNAGRRQVTVTQRRTKADFAAQMKLVCDDWYPDAEVIRVVLGNRNTHTIGALYEAFPAAEARRLAARLEFHYTPKHRG